MMRFCAGGYRGTARGSATVCPRCLTIKVRLILEHDRRRPPMVVRRRLGTLHEQGRRGGGGRQAGHQRCQADVIESGQFVRRDQARGGQPVLDRAQHRGIDIDPQRGAIAADSGLTAANL